ncbi:MAG: sugar-binding domain-containing protein, partial [Flavobacterium sp.]
MKKTTIITFLCWVAFICPAAAQTKSIQNFEVPVLTPFPAAIAAVSSPVVSLNGSWDFDIKEQAQKAKKIQVPGEWEMQGYSVKEGQTALYTKKLAIPANWKGNQIKIRFDAVSSHALVKINGKTVGDHEGSFVPFEVDITKQLTYKEDILEVEVQALTVSDRLACTSQYACHTVGGLLRKVTLFAVAPIYIASANNNTVFDASYTNASLTITNAVASTSSASEEAYFQFTLFDVTGKVVAKKTSAVKKITANTTADIETVLEIKSPKHWDPEHPYLYKLQTELFVNN